jgi:putative hydrolase of the HAD superfamily
VAHHRHRAQWHAYARAYGGDAAEDLAARILAAEQEAWARVKGDGSSARLEEILALAGVESDHPGTSAAQAAYEEFWEPHTFTDPDVVPLFTGLRERGIKIGVLSNTIWSREYHEAVFARDGVLDLIDGAVYSSEIEHAKPHREAFAAALRAVDVDDPAAAVYVGDRAYEDVHGAQRAGLRAVLVPHSDIPPDQQVPVDVEPDAVVHRLLDLLDVVDALVGPRRVTWFDLPGDPGAGTLALLVLAALVAGWVDAVVGGGGPRAAAGTAARPPAAEPAQVLATNKLSSVFGTATATATYLRRVRPDPRTAVPMALAALGGSHGGRGLRESDPQRCLPPPRAGPASARRAVHLAPARPRPRQRAAPRPPPPRHRGVTAGSASASTTGSSAPAPGSFLVFASSGCSGYGFLEASATAKITNLATNIGALAIFVPRARRCGSSGWSWRRPTSRAAGPGPGRRQPGGAPSCGSCSSSWSPSWCCAWAGTSPTAAERRRQPAGARCGRSRRRPSARPRRGRPPPGAGRPRWWPRRCGRRQRRAGAPPSPPT